MCECVCVCSSVFIIEYLKCHWNTLPSPLQFVGLRAGPAAGFGEVYLLPYYNILKLNSNSGLTGYLPNLLWQCGI